MQLKFWRSLAFLILLIGLVFGQVHAETPRINKGTLGQFSLRGRVVQVNEEYRFAVVNLGSSDGLKKGMLLSVFHGDEEAAKIKVSKVRRHISACDIQLVFTGRTIGIGDVVVYKKSFVPAEIFQKITKPLEHKEMVETEPVVVDIDAPKSTILRKALLVLNEFGVIITKSDPAKYTVNAYKNLELPLTLALFTDGKQYIRNKVFYNVEVSSTPTYNRLVIHLRWIYHSEGETYNRQIEKESSTYKEAQIIGFTIKDLAEQG